MKETIDRTSSVSARVSIELPADRVNQHLHTYFTQVAKQARISGFRPGKAPVHVVKKMYGQEAASSIGEKLISEALLEVVKRHDLKLILPPKLVAVDAAKEDTPFKFEAELDLKPDVPAVDLTKIELDDVEIKPVTDEEIAQRIESIKDSFAHFHHAPASHEITKEDMAVVSYEGFDGDQKIEKLTTATQELELGKGAVLPEFEQALIGKKAGDSVRVEVTFPEDHRVEEIKGKKIRFEMKVLEVQAKHRPEFNEENLLERVDPGAKSFEDFKIRLKERMEAEAIQNRQTALREALGNQLATLSQFDVSPRQVEMVAENIARERAEQLAQMGFGEDQLRERITEILEASKKSAEREIRVSYVLDRIARDAGIELKLEDIEAKFEQIAKLSGLSVTDVKKFYFEKDEEGSSPRLERLQMDLRDEKSLDYALSKVTIKRGTPST